MQSLSYKWASNIISNFFITLWPSGRTSLALKYPKNLLPHKYFFNSLIFSTCFSPKIWASNKSIFKPSFHLIRKNKIILRISSEKHLAYVHKDFWAIARQNRSQSSKNNIFWNSLNNFCFWMRSILHQILIKLMSALIDWIHSSASCWFR